MDKLVAVVAKVPKKVRYDDDAVDRLSHRYTTIVLTVFAILSTMQQYVGKPITCWVPKEFTGSHKKYANSYCWVKNTYWLPFEHEIPKVHEGDKRGEIVYYQWIPFVFLLMAFFFYIPCRVWRSFNSKSGVDADNILEAAATFQRTEKVDKNDKTLRLICNQIDRFLGNRTYQKTGCNLACERCMTSTFCFLCGKKFGNYLLILYVCTKLLYIANVFGQLFIMNVILKTNYNLYGAEVLHSLMTVPSEDANVFLNETVFPKVTMCDFMIRRLGNVHRYTVQCLLPINLYTEKMFVFIWFWFVLVLFMSCLSLLVWLLRSLFPGDRVRYIRNHLTVCGKIVDDTDPSLCYDFVQEYLRQDGVFLIRLINHNTNAITVNDILARLWDNWQDNRPTPAKIALHRNGTRPKGTPPPPPPSKPMHLFHQLSPSAPNGLDEPDGGRGVVYRPVSTSHV